MKHLILSASILFLPLLAENLRVYQYTGVRTQHTDKNGKNEKIHIEREIDPKCLDLAITNEMIWEGSYANPSVPIECKAMFVTSVGQVQPMKLHPDVETYGEMEVMKFIKTMQDRDDMMLIDTRMENWYRYRTIPGAVNISHLDISKANLFPKAFQKALKTLGIIQKNGQYDFSNAKIIVLFCNGAWCSQSPKMIEHLLKLGYPAKKIKWYRGGMHDWLTLGMTSTRAK
ncbi:rhodanese-like domain-containing protein [Sulfurovum sp. NBC37-1]|uniref:rhodanese-like domain-containing protein n=1 Tax=Sulfurovum sp. (strain NBC37-1) TaxID=387093 RepID=UPI000158744B|nr:rhodanese-like domain-containing protein [Sulfurovum sp. NBC37-1]BAF72070.1 conserved hypothetical protein [Sulfurovum sp. NBC37-1]